MRPNWMLWWIEECMIQIDAPCHFMLDIFLVFMYFFSQWLWNFSIKPLIERGGNEMWNKFNFHWNHFIGCVINDTHEYSLCTPIFSTANFHQNLINKRPHEKKKSLEKGRMRKSNCNSPLEKFLINKFTIISIYFLNNLMRTYRRTQRRYAFK